ncbi:Fanconi anemia group D2 protein isoform X1 [Poecilia formosa]|uniref:Fanconi anemia group D2 protein isoform X1 n=1 Tax=Poecilia formosa TaxID=48698 RepID=UPI0007B81C77|nr:PREDICTED: Fanconi anemia group D2 protein isoform X1 [Poecilia formosa]XP_016536365.1 PREDICTED: Fanconi anemia group D2 protein isoform X1 [Poecilia formosa]
MMRKKRRSSVEKVAGTTAAPKAKKSRNSSRQPKEAASEETSETVFVTFVKKAGVSLKHNGASHEIAVDQVVFQKRIQQQLQKSPRYPDILKEFVTDLEAYVENPDRFRNCLLPCVPQPSEGDVRSVSSFQESLIRMLLGIEMLQTLIISTLLEKLPEFMFDGIVDGGLNIPRMIINQLKWLDRVVDTKELAAKLMELVSVAPVEVQRDIITSLPEILEDSQHNDIARELNALLQENTQLTVPILDALSSLNLSSSLLTEVREAVMATLAAVQLEDLPVVVKFILHSVSASNAHEVVSNLRQKLELEQCVLPPVLQASQIRMKSKSSAGSASTATASGSSQDSVTLVLDCIKSAVRFQKTISEAWLKAIESVDDVEDHKVLDLLVLFILHCTNANQSRRGAERVLKLKVRTGLMREALLQKTFRDYSQVMRGYFPSILALAQSLVRSPDPCVVPFGGQMYSHSFTAFDSYCQQEVVGSLVTHVCSGVSGEVDVALELLCSLVVEKPSEMALYAVFVKGILDYMDNLTAQQIRRLFHLLSRLAFGQQQQGSHIQDDMHIVIRKQLSSTVPKYKRIGIIGAVMIVGSMGALRPKGKESQSSSLSQETLRQVTALLELVKSSSESSPEAAALYYDELANLIWSSALDPQVEEMIGMSVLDDFQDDFVVDLGPDIAGSFIFPACALYNLEEDESQGGIAINLLPLLAKETQHKGEQQRSQIGKQKQEKRVSPLCLSPFFRLLRLCEEKRHQGDLEEIDALVGCPLILTNMDVVDKVDSLSKAEREFLCSLLFHTINWFREVVNAFCTQKETEMKMKVMTRLQNITVLQALLERALAGTPGYMPPVSNFDGETTDGISFGVPVNKAKKDGTGKKRKAPGKNAPEGASQPEEATEADETQQEQPEKEKEKENRLSVRLTAYRPFFRELDMEVLSVLQCGLLSRSLLDSELHTKVQEEVVLGPTELVFLLEDMQHKLEFSLTAAPAKRAPFLKMRADKTVGFSHLQQRSTKDIASYCVQLLPALCSHLENCHNHFQTLLSENNGVVDGPSTDVEEHQVMSSGYQLLLQVINTTLNWSGFSQPGQRSLLKKALGVLAGRLKEGGPELTLEQLVKHSFEYLLNFRSTMPSLSTALCLSQLLSTVSEKGGNPGAYREQTASLARRFLNQSWVTASGEKERGSKFNEALHTLLSIYLEHVDDVLKAVEEIAGEGITELINASKDESSASWPTLNRQTFLVFYKVLMAELEKAARRIPAGKTSDSSEVRLLGAALPALLFVTSISRSCDLVKVFDSRPVLNVSLKYGRLFLESFLKLGMPLLDYSFKRHKEDVQSLLKTFQLSTRQLHHMCGHSKIHQDTSLTNHVPAVKKSLELFVYRVKAMLTLNNCQEAFWMGNLKNRNLKGEEILSQRSQGSDDDDDDDEEEEEGNQELPPAQEQSDDEVQDGDSD